MKALTLRELCSRLAVNPRTVRRWIAAGAFPEAAVRQGGTFRRWAESDIRDWEAGRWRKRKRRSPTT